MTGGTIAEDYKKIARELNLKVTEATRLVKTLKECGLLAASGTGQKLLTLYSPRLLKEYQKAVALTIAAAEKAKKGAVGRWRKS